MLHGGHPEINALLLHYCQYELMTPSSTTSYLPTLMNHHTRIMDDSLPSFQSSFTSSLPGDPEPANTRRQVDACYSFVDPTPVPAPRTIAYSRDVAALLKLPIQFCESQAFAEVMGGNRLLNEMQPFAMCYGGHQFGSWAGQLGDGRAINLGEVHDESGQHWAAQLKGAGPTPYSRRADGRAVLRSSVREYLCSEAMHHLGVPTTRALSLIATGEEILRDMFYDGNPRYEPGAIVCRVAPSFIRFGNFEILASRNQTDLLRQLLDFTITSEFPHLGPPCKETYLAWLAEVCRTTARMIIEWLRVGFVHGVMNTDNMSVHGITIDYGPYGWLDNFDKNWTPNTTDASQRRYRFGNQSQIALWNLVQLAIAIHPLIQEAEPLQQALATYTETIDRDWQAMMTAKLGLTEQHVADSSLFEELESLLQAEETDMTIFYRRLAHLDTERALQPETSTAEIVDTIVPAMYFPISDEHATRMTAWLRRYARRRKSEGRSDEACRAAMNRVNPKYVLRNYLAQLAIDKAEKEDYSMIHELAELLRNPYDEQPKLEQYAGRRPDWAKARAGCSMLSCSS